MTGQQIYELASAFLYEKDGEDADSKFHAVNFLNNLMAETFCCENSIREYKGKELLDEPPFISSLDETIPYQFELTRTALPYGLAAIYFAEAMDNYHEALYRNKYSLAVEEAHKFNKGEVDRG